MLNKRSPVVTKKLTHKAKQTPKKKPSPNAKAIVKKKQKIKKPAKKSVNKNTSKLDDPNIPAKIKFDKTLRRQDSDLTEASVGPGFDELDPGFYSDMEKIADGDHGEIGSIGTIPTLSTLPPVSVNFH
jgi:hypothetical protein